MKNAICILAILAAIPCPARTITVDDDNPADFNNIQAAIDDANDGDTVEIQPGTYTGDGNRDIDFLGKPITVTSTDPNDPNIVTQTIIDCNATEEDPHRGFYFHSNEGVSSVISGLTITNGHAEQGGGMYIDNSSPTILNCTFTENSATGAGGRQSSCGGAVFNMGSSPMILNCIFSLNQAQDVGGGMYNGFYSDPVLHNSIFTGNAADELGGAMFNTVDSDPLLLSCTFTENAADEGGGMCNLMSSPTLTDCTFISNSAGNGGGMFNELSSPTLTDCTFISNSGDNGGGMYDHECSPKLTQCAFIGNFADRGGGMHCNGGSPMLTECTFVSNLAEFGAGMDTSDTDPTLTKCTFVSNWADNGGAINIYMGGEHTLANCTLIENTAQDGGGLLCYGGRTTMTNCTLAENTTYASTGTISCYSSAHVELKNCILWANAPATGYEIFLSGEGGGLRAGYDTAWVTYSDVHAGQSAVFVADDCTLNWGSGNIDADPCFADPNNGNYHLQSQAGRYDPNTETWVIDEVTSACIDAGDPMDPIGPEPFPNGGMINMGAYGGTEEASKSYFGQPPCETIVAGDINGDCQINFEDFRLMALHWCESL